MWEELEKEIKLYDESNLLKIELEPLYGVGNRNAKFLFLFDQVTNSMNENKSIKKSNEFDKLSLILDFVKIDINNCYFTCLNKYYNKMNKIDFENRKYDISLFLKELYLIQPEYIVTVGEDVFNVLFTYYTTKNNKVDILKNVGKIFDFYGKKLTPIYDMEYVSKINNDKKRELVNILKEINK